VVRDVDDDGIGPEEEAQLQSQRGLVVERVFPDVARHELGQDYWFGLFEVARS
jgi:hypothetical protein